MVTQNMCVAEMANIQILYLVTCTQGQPHLPRSRLFQRRLALVTELEMRHFPQVIDLTGLGGLNSPDHICAAYLG